MCRDFTFHRVFSSLRIALVVAFFFGLSSAHSQDFHYSQFYNAPSTVSPALTGIFNGDERLTGSLRDQWRSVRVPWFNFTVAYDRKFYPARAEKGFLAAGVMFNYDRQGDAKLALNNLNLSASYTRILNHRNLITIGILFLYSD